MSILRCGRAPCGRSLRGRIVAVLFPAMIAGGCGHDSYQASNEGPNWYAGGPRQTAAAVPIPVEMEDDGRPAQLPPRADARAAPDDPTQPWSPNYGGPATVIRRPQHAQPQPAPASRRVASADDE